MNTLIYLTNQSNNKALGGNKIFFQELRKGNDSKLIVTVESDFDYQYLKKRKKLLGIQKIINLYKNDSSLLRYDNTSKFSIEHLLKIEPAKFNNKKKLVNFLGYFENNLLKTINENKIQNFCYLSLFGVFRSLGLFLSYQVIKKLPIKIFFPFSTPLKGRFMIYDNIYFESKELDQLINQSFQKIKNSDKKRLDSYFKEYKKFKIHHLSYINDRKSKIDLNTVTSFNIKSFAKKIQNRVYYDKRKNLPKSSNSPFAVILYQKIIIGITAARSESLNIPQH